MPPTDFPSMEPYRNGWHPHLAPPPQTPRPRPNYHTHILLFLMTMVTTIVAGMVWEGLHPIEQIREFHRGLPYALTLLTILFFMRWDIISRRAITAWTSLYPTFSRPHHRCSLVRLAPLFGCGRRPGIGEPCSMLVQRARSPGSAWHCRP